MRSQLLLAAAMAVMIPVQAQRADQIREWNAQSARGLSPEVQERRTQALYELMAEDPRSALRLAMLESRSELEGRLEGTVEDDFERGYSRTHWQLRTARETLKVFFEGDGPADCSAPVRVRGVRIRDRLAAETWSAAKGPRFATSCSVKTGTQNIAVILVRTPSTALPANVTAAAMQTAFFSGVQSLDGYWRESSYNRTSATGAVYGPFTLAANYACSETESILTAAINAANATVDFSQFGRVVIVMPSSGSCSIGYGSIGCRSMPGNPDGVTSASVVWLRSDFLTKADATISVAAHELGHNMELRHASTKTYSGMPLGPLGTGTHDEYGDYLSIMGLSYSFNGNYLLPHPNAPHKSVLGWFGGSNVQTISTAGNYTILPFETSTTGLQALRILRGAGSNAYLWLEFRQPLGYDATLSPFGYGFNGALIHYEDPLLSYSANYTHLLNFGDGQLKNASLKAGSSWTDPYSLLRLQVNSASGSGLNVSVFYDTPCATPSPAAPSLSNAAQQAVLTVSASCAWTAVSNTPWITINSGSSGSGGGTVTYSVTANGSGTRSGTITVGRQHVTVTQSAAGGSCSYSLNSSAAVAGSAGGPGSFGITTGAGCAWQAASNASWITLNTSSGSGSGTVSYTVLANTGDRRKGTITAQGQTFTVTQSGVVYGPVRDFEGNGSSDVFIYDPAGGIGYAGLSNGAGGFSYSSMPFTTGMDAIRAIEVSGDGRSDLISYKSSNALGYTGLGNGNGTFAFQSLFWGPGFNFVEAGDFNGDGRGDALIYRSGDGTSYVGLSNGSGGWTYKYALVSIGFTHVLTPDVNGDGRSDVFFYRSTDGLAFLGLANGDGTFSFSSVPAGSGFNLLDAADVNGDGRADVVLYSATNGVFKTGLSTGTAFSFGLQSISTGFTSIRLLQFNTDGKADLALYNKNTAIGYLGTGAGNGTFTFGSLFWGPGFDHVLAQDLNGDRKTDLVLYNSSTGTAYTAISSGSSFSYVYAYWGPGRILAR